MAESERDDDRYLYVEVYSPDEVLEFIESVPDDDGPAWLMPVGYLHDSDGVAFNVSFRWAQSEAGLLWRSQKGDFGLVRVDGAAGILVDAWGASPEDHSPTDAVYGVQAWPRTRRRHRSS